MSDRKREEGRTRIVHRDSDRPRMEGAPFAESYGARQMALGAWEDGSTARRSTG